MKTKFLMVLITSILVTTFAGCEQQTTTDKVLSTVDLTLSPDVSTNNNMQPVDIESTGLTINKEHIHNLASKLIISTDFDDGEELQQEELEITTLVDDKSLKVYIDNHYFMTIKFFNNSDIKLTSIFNCDEIEYDLGDMENFFLSELDNYSAYVVDMYDNDQYKQLIADTINSDESIDNFDWLISLRAKVLIDGQNLIINKVPVS